MCPDNNLLTPEGLQVLDFESASFHSLFQDAAYARMPFPTCWCVSRLPAGLAVEVEQRYRKLVVGTFPDLTDDEVWEAGVRSAVALWTVTMTPHYLWTVQEKGDAPMHSARSDLPTTRQVARHRWSSLVELLEPVGELPVLVKHMRALLEATVSWNVEPLPYYPAFST